MTNDECIPADDSTGWTLDCGGLLSLCGGRSHRARRAFAEACTSGCGRWGLRRQADRRKAAAGSKHYPQVGGRCSIPKGLRPPAQGCEERATLGKRKDDHQPQRGCDPNAQPGRNPVGVDAMFPAISQGSSFLATLGFGAESLWDSQSMGARKLRVMARAGRRSPRLSAPAAHPSRLLHRTLGNTAGTNCATFA